jgi:uncharacterized protein YegL
MIFILAVTLCNAARVTRSERSVTLAQDSGFEVQHEVPSVVHEPEAQVPSLQPVTAPTQHIALDEALQKTTKLPAEIRSMLRSQHASAESSEWKNTQERRLKTLRGGKQNPADDPSGYPTLDKVRQVLNELYQETNEEADITATQCYSFEASTKGTIEQNTQMRVTLATEIASAREEIAYANSKMQEAERQVTQLEEDLRQHESECEQGRLELEELIKITEADHSVAGEINDKVDCEANTVGAFVQCWMQNDNSHFRLRAANGTIVSFKSQAAFLAIQNAAQVVHGLSAKANKTRQDPEKEEPLEDGSPTAEEIDDQEQSTEWMESITLGGMPEKCGPPGETVDVGEKCSALKDAIGQMVGEIKFVLTETRNRLTDHTAHCTGVTKNLNGQIGEWSSILDQSQISLAKATQTLNMNEDELRLRVDEFKETKKSLIDTINDCNDKFQKFHEEKCGLSTIRLELYRIVGGNPYIQDCEVSPWVEQECSATCGGGTQVKTREVVQEQVFGAACPPLSETVSCAGDPCPVDCAVNDWSGWSECSKDCGGGIESRGRFVEIQAEHGGMPCPGVQETRGCNTHACDRDCTLHEWTEWTMCNRQCGGGQRLRYKHVDMPAMGEGECAAEHEEDPSAAGGGARVEMLECNTHKCYPNLKCKAKQDLVLTLDASGSIGSYGFAKTQAFAKDLIGRVTLSDDVEKVGIVKFSHEATIESAMSTDKAALDAAIDAMTFPMSTTETGQAIDTALNIAQQGGRGDAETIIFVVTDGVPTDKESARVAAERARQQGLTRLVFVGVGSPSRLDIPFMEELATFPAKANVLSAANYQDLENRVGSMLAGFCANLECDEAMTGIGEDYRGCQSMTRSGAECQGWDEWHPHWHYYRDWNTQFAGKGLGGGHNFCRNPDGDAGGIWCWTKDPNVPWAYCDQRDNNDVPVPADA